ncbi:uncharacterized protein N7484_002096 [Penicillium longicatenatum]|uniref:uncharacterized protein n=1 Tax=Penicillium longicatenatum TaxID=1561947 RepID=UPI002546D144|nr:uncharacterized protein N7484_002096 [Penicillium longicatenatum]KAJ5658447.1 hypothetical protein N7484_002096 [Penicillium longicatenatum]
MSRILLFCVAEEAKSLIPKISREFSHKENVPPPFWLVESNVCPRDQAGFKVVLKDDEPFESDFINASKEQCQKWAQENWDKVDGISHEDIAIADERTSRDGTLLMSSWHFDNVDLDGWGPLPPRVPAWYDFRVHHRAVDAFEVSQHWCPLDEALPIYYGQPEKYTDEAGVFDSIKVELWMTGKIENENFI